jgi:hypothetical protein
MFPIVCSETIVEGDISAPEDGSHDDTLSFKLSTGFVPEIEHCFFLDEFFGVVREGNRLE